MSLSVDVPPGDHRAGVGSPGSDGVASPGSGSAMVDPKRMLVKDPKDLSLEEYEVLHANLVAQIALCHGPGTAMNIVGKTLASFDFAKFMPTHAYEQSTDGSERSDGEDGVAQARWKKAMKISQSKKLDDPWRSRGIHELPMEHAKRHRYDPRSRSWLVDDVIVKMESSPFGCGAMRECYAMKKRPHFAKGRSVAYQDWKTAPNFVAKLYKPDQLEALKVDRQIYFDDVTLQQEAKLLGEEYNQVNPPKKVDFVQCCVIEFPEREGKPIYCVEGLIEGEYIKYNSNSGFLEADDMRNTPQAFSHFTFEFTEGDKLCVDVQGVGDMYTDPQIHTVDGQGFGAGNLGARGMALFFKTHVCNDLCRAFGLTPLPRCTESKTSLERQLGSSHASMSVAEGTVSRSSSMSGYASGGLSSWQGTPLTEAITPSSPGMGRSPTVAKRTIFPPPGELQIGSADSSSSRGSFTPIAHSHSLQSHASDGCDLDLLELTLVQIPSVASAFAEVHWELSGIHAEEMLTAADGTVEGLNADVERRAGLFHLHAAAVEGHTHAQMVMARAMLGMRPEIGVLAELIEAGRAEGEVPEEGGEATVRAFRFTAAAAEAGVRTAAAAAAKACAEGLGCDAPDLLKAIRYLTMALDDSGDGEGGATAPRNLKHCEVEAAGLFGLESMDDHVLYAKRGELFLAGGDGRDPDPQSAYDDFNAAAEAAMEVGKGKLANKYYGRAAEAEGLIE